MPSSPANHPTSAPARPRRFPALGWLVPCLPLALALGCGGGSGSGWSPDPMVTLPPMPTMPATRADASPAIHRITPGVVWPGDVVTISGSHLSNATEIRFTGQSVDRFRQVNGETIEVQVPDGARSGPITVVTGRGRVDSSRELHVISRGPSSWPAGQDVPAASARPASTTAVPGVTQNPAVPARPASTAAVPGVIHGSAVPAAPTPGRARGRGQPGRPADPAAGGPAPTAAQPGPAPEFHIFGRPYVRHERSLRTSR